MTQADFRPDIQGLRGLAVLIVVIYHAGLWLPGGFVGVDVFLVVSGFVVGRGILHELERSGSFSFGNFYVRRARRLMPALSVTAVLTIIASALLIHPGRYQSQVAQTATAATFFSSNMFLWRTGEGYFDPSTHLNPLLHTWSLSLEEQFYLIFPLLLFTSFKLTNHPSGPIQRRRLMLLVSLICLLSIIFCLLTNGDLPIQLEVASNPEKFVFYSLPTRFWEFGVGFLLIPVSERLGECRFSGLGNWIGVSLILFSAVWFDDSAVLPGLAALVPVGGAALLITFGRRVGVASNPLTHSMMRKIGDISYSWYLLHWPFIVLSQLYFADSLRVRILAAAVSVVPSWFLFRKVESRFRLPRVTIGPPRALSLVGTLVVISLLASAGLLVISARKFGVSPPPGWEDTRWASVNRCIDTSSLDWPENQCSVGVASSSKSVFLVGDSFADSASDGVIDAALDNGWRAHVWARSGCPFLVDRPTFGVEDCAGFQEAAMDVITRIQPDVVVIANRSTGYTYSEVPDDTFWATIETSTGERAEDREEALAAWAEGFGSAVHRLNELGIYVVVILPVPEFPVDFVVRQSILRPLPSSPSISLEYVNRRREGVLIAERDAVASLNVTFLDPSKVLCDSENCSAVSNGQWLYMDKEHLNPAGSLKLSPLVAEALNEAVPAS